VRAGRALALTALAFGAAACGGGGGSPAPPTVAPAREFTLAWQSAKTLAAPGTATLRFAVRTPDGKVLTHYRTGAGPHTGVHLIIVRDDLSSIIHLHPAIPASGELTIPVMLPRAGRYRVLVDVYPAASAGPRNFQLTRDLQVGTGDVKAPLPAYTPVVRAGGLTFRVAKLPVLHLAEPGTMVVNVTDAHGKPVTFKPFYGALAHAIFFRKGSLAYFHTHICAPGAPGCASLVGGPALRGSGTAGGRLHVGVLLPQAGTWRLFLQFRVRGQILTAPFTLRVH
jgi:hypothetical protein